MAVLFIMLLVTVGAVMAFLLFASFMGNACRAVEEFRERRRY